MEPFRSIALFAASTVAESANGSPSPIFLAALIAGGGVLIALVLILGLSDHNER